jgi:hypothetical protein
LQSVHRSAIIQSPGFFSGLTRTEVNVISKHIIKINLKGKKALPDKIGMGELGDLLKHLESAIKASIPIEDRIEHSESPDRSEPIISLVSLREGNSVDMGTAILGFGISAIRDISISIDDRRFDMLEPKTHDELRRASNWLVKRGLELELEANEELNVRAFHISKRDPIPPPTLPDFTIDGQATIWGYLVKVGGEKPRSIVYFPDKSKITLTSDELVAKDLAAHLYDEVGIEGIATWRSRDWKLVAFKPLRVLDYRPSNTDIEQTFQDLSSATQGRWEGVDAEEYIKDLRDENS